MLLGDVGNAMGIVLLASPNPEPVATAQHKSNTTPANEARLRSHSTSKDTQKPVAPAQPPSLVKASLI